VEQWKVGRLVIKKIWIIFDFMVDKNFTNNPTLQHSKTHYSSIPLLQHSNRGEAPNLNARAGGDDNPTANRL
jgi:hypothetical protein